MADTADRDRTGTIDSPDPELKHSPGESGQGAGPARPARPKPPGKIEPGAGAPATRPLSGFGSGRSAFADQETLAAPAAARPSAFSAPSAIPAPDSVAQPESEPEPFPVEAPAGAQDWTHPWPAVQPSSPDPVGNQPAPMPPAQGGRTRRRVFWAGGAGVVLIGLYAGAAWAVSGSAPKGTTVAGVPVGGKGRAAIISALTTASQQQDGKLPVALGSRTAQLDLSTSGLTVDPRATAGELTGFTLDPVSVWRHISGGGAQEAVGAAGKPLREGALEAQLRALAGSLTTKPVDAGVVFGGKAANGDQASSQAGADVTPVVRNATVGTVLNISRSAAAIRAGWLGGARPVQLPVETRQPAITTGEAQQALKNLAQPAVSGPLALRVGDVEVPVQPADFAPALAIAPAKDGTLELTVDGDKLSAAVLEASPELGKAPKDARIELRNGTPHIVPGVEGVTLDPEKLGPAVLPALTSAKRTASVPTTVEKPEFSTDDAKKLGVDKKVSTFSTILTTNALRTENLRVAARTVNGTLVLPGETFSLNDTLGERTAAKGYHQAPAINGGRLVQDYGGGVSQMATTIFNNVFFAGLEDIHHKPHSFYISRYPEGREATVNYPTVDLKWRNDSKYGVLIQANVTNTVNVSFWSTKVWDIEASKGPRTNFRTPTTVYDPKPGCVAQDANGGFDVSVARIFKKHGDVLRRQTFHTTYIAEDRVVCSAKPKPQPTTIAPD